MAFGPRSSPLKLVDDPYHSPEGDVLEFKLTYEGKLFGANGKDTRAGHKHDIRRVFHPQLKRLWKMMPQLSEPFDFTPFPFIMASTPGPSIPYEEHLANRFACGPYRLVPLVVDNMGLLCSIDILLLRADKSGGIIKSGDIDNRLKTVFDSLRIPQDTNELAGNSPSEDENPLFCLLQDDRLISHVSVSSDVILQPLFGATAIDPNDVRLIMTVIIRPTMQSWGAMKFL
jgi:hypothetical protein